eukprot:TRINITY_DN4522_c0_g4_i1.p1 TRINITY_DN4522_c0_g4~~TRINITY_DN4522_c0_g4_i1.p1  ORF type:complete len:654 (+),score=74.04 TRINITY_DN4522_c0_g4_i1:72-2033(+)
MELCEKIKSFKNVLQEIVQNSKLGKQTDLQKSLQRCSAYILSIKNDWRKLCLATESQRENSQKCKQEVDQTDLQLQNLLYIKRYYEGEIQSNMNFNSEFSEEDLSLLSQQEFYEQAPENFKEQITDDHTLMLQRLSHELQMRKQLVNQGQELKDNLKTVSQTLSRKRAEQQDLKGLLSSVETSAIKLEQVLYQNSNFTLSPFTDQRVQLLPLPMYIVYSQINACAQMFNLGARVDVHGDSEEANAWISKIIRVDLGGNGAESRGKRHKSDTNHKGKKQRLEHPLSLSVTLTNVPPQSDSTPLLVVQISYLPGIRLMVARCDFEDVLSAIFPGDDGSRIPSEIAVYASMENGSNYQKQIPEGFKPYKWLQDLGGMDFLPTMQLPQQFADYHDQQKIIEGMDMYRQQKRALHVIQRLIQVRRGVLSLEQIEQYLVGKKLPPIVLEEDGSLSGGSYRSEIYSWAEVKNPTKQMKDLLRWNQSGQGDVAIEEDGEILSTENSGQSEQGVAAMETENVNSVPVNFRAPYKIYTLMLRQKYAATIKLLVQVFIDYPLHAPQILVQECTKTGDGIRMLSKPVNVTQQYQMQIKAIEEEVNLTILDTIQSGDEAQVFSHQLHHMVRCFDLLVQMMLQNESNLMVSLPLKAKLRGKAKFLKF